MAIIDSVRKLAEKVGANTNGRTIADQMNLINQHLEATNGRDISEAVNYYADKAGGSTPTPETFEVEISISDFRSEGTANKTYDEALAAINAGKQLNVIYTTAPDGGTMNMSGIPYKMHTKIDREVNYIVIPSQYQASSDDIDMGVILLWKDDNSIVVGMYD